MANIQNSKILCELCVNSQEQAWVTVRNMPNHQDVSSMWQGHLGTCPGPGMMLQCPSWASICPPSSSALFHTHGSDSSQLLIELELRWGCRAVQGYLQASLLSSLPLFPPPWALSTPIPAWLFLSSFFSMWDWPLFGPFLETPTLQDLWLFLPTQQLVFFLQGWSVLTLTLTLPI